VCSCIVCVAKNRTARCHRPPCACARGSGERGGTRDGGVLEVQHVSRGRSARGSHAARERLVRRPHPSPRLAGNGQRGGRLAELHAETAAAAGAPAGARAGAVPVPLLFRLLFLLINERAVFGEHVFEPAQRQRAAQRRGAAQRVAHARAPAHRRAHAQAELRAALGGLAARHSRPLRGRAAESAHRAAAEVEAGAAHREQTRQRHLARR
jgi:hypothetical protein